MLSEPDSSPFCWCCIETVLLIPLFWEHYLSTCWRYATIKLTDSIGFHGMVGAYFSVAVCLIRLLRLAGHDLYYRLADISSNDFLFGLWIHQRLHHGTTGSLITHYLSVAGRKWRNWYTYYLTGISSELIWTFGHYSSVDFWFISIDFGLFIPEKLFYSTYYSAS